MNAETNTTAVQQYFASQGLTQAGSFLGMGFIPLKKLFKKTAPGYESVVKEFAYINEHVLNIIK